MCKCPELLFTFIHRDAFVAENLRLISDRRRRSGCRVSAFLRPRCPCRSTAHKRLIWLIGISDVVRVGAGVRDAGIAKKKSYRGERPLSQFFFIYLFSNTSFQILRESMPGRRTEGKNQQLPGCSPLIKLCHKAMGATQWCKVVLQHECGRDVTILADILI